MSIIPIFLDPDCQYYHSISLLKLCLLIIFLNNANNVYSTLYSTLLRCCPSGILPSDSVPNAYFPQILPLKHASHRCCPKSILSSDTAPKAYFPQMLSQKHDSLRCCSKCILPSDAIPKAYCPQMLCQVYGLRGVSWWQSVCYLIWHNFLALLGGWRKLWYIIIIVDRLEIFNWRYFVNGLFFQD